MRRMCVLMYIINIIQLLNLLPSFDWQGLVFGMKSSISFLHARMFVGQCCWLNVVLQAPLQRSRTGNPSMRNPASREIISDSVELSETEICFLHIKLTGTNVLLPKIHKTPPEVDFESSRSPAKSESWNRPNLHCCAVFPHDNIVGIRLCDECTKSIWPIFCHMPESILGLILQAC